MGNLKTCQGCQRELPLSMYPRRKDHCFHCTFNGPGKGKEDILHLSERNKPKVSNEELRYVKHETELIQLLKSNQDGLSTKEISQGLGVTTDATYRLCKTLLDENKLVMRKEHRGAGKAQNIYTLPSLSSIMPERLEAPELQDTPIGVQRTSTKTNSIQDKEFLLIKKWTELKNRLIMDGTCGEALKIMVTMEEEANL